MKKAKKKKTTPVRSKPARSLPPGTRKKKITPVKKGEKPEKVRFNMLIPSEVANRVRNAVWWERMTLAEFVEGALRAEVDRREAKKGKPYPPRKKQLRPGRPTQ